MASNSTISISFELKDGKDGLKVLSVQAKDLQKVLGATVSEADKLNKQFINFAAVATGIDSVSNTFKSVQSVINDLSGAYAAQIEVEKKLETTMRNSMDARAEDIQSIKDLCSAQQELGVIGDEVQLAGAQEMATYLSEKTSLEKLIPVMNDMLAQQYGLNASQENAAGIATMLGKVMNGQVGALSRYGYTFDEAQEKILKFGTEAQRAAVLCDVVSASVGGMNAELAKTDIGKQKQLENTLGDLKEKAGELAQKLSKVVSSLAYLTIAGSGIFKVVIGMRTATAAVKSFNVATKATNAVITLTGIFSKKSALGLEMLRASAVGAEKAAFGLQIAIRGLLIATGVGAAITLLIYVIGKLIDKHREATESANRLTAAQERQKRATEETKKIADEENTVRANTKTLLDINIAKLNEFSGTKEQEKKLVEEMNNTYGETMGYFSSVADWYNALISNSEAYCRQMVIEAKTRTLANLIAKKELEKHNVKYDETGKARLYSTKKGTETVGTGNYVDYGGYAQEITKVVETASEWDKANQRVAEYNAEIEALQSQLAVAVKEASNLNYAVTGSKDRPYGGITTPDNKIKALEGSLKYLDEKLSKLKVAYELAIDDRSRQQLMAEIKKLESEKHIIEMQIEGVFDRPTYDAEKAVKNSKFNVDGKIEKPQALKLEKIETSGDDPLTQKAEQLKKINEQLQIGQTLTGAFASAFSGLGQVIGGTTGALVSFAGQAMTAISDIIPQILALIGVKESEAIASGTASGAALPFPANIAAIASIIATVSGVFASLPKFANGGIISGPTVGLMGEYAGASNNPEVVAPLDKLRGMLQPTNDFSGGVVKFKIDGRTLVGVLEKENKVKQRS